MGCWKWAWAIRQSWAVGRASTRWSWRSRKPSSASWQPFWRVTVHSYDLSPRHLLKKPQTLAHFLIYKVSGMILLWPLIAKTQTIHAGSVSLKLEWLIKVTEETGWIGGLSSLQILNWKVKHLYEDKQYNSEYWRSVLSSTLATRISSEKLHFLLSSEASLNHSCTVTVNY